jgi:parvulin-like peptidyl-prolyl isomerase
MEMAGLSEERLKDQVRLKRLADGLAAKDKVDAFIKAHPSYFNGTKVQASHILITCQPVAATADQKAALAKLTKIAADLKAGKTTFGDAAKEHSACPSGKKANGDLGEFAFTAMVPTFAMTAFDMKVGQTSGIIRTQFGFHLIQVTKRTDGTEKPGEDASEVARNSLLAQLQNQVFDQAMTTCLIVISK